MNNTVDEKIYIDTLADLRKQLVDIKGGIDYLVMRIDTCTRKIANKED